jgi:hypothetical protein
MRDQEKGEGNQEMNQKKIIMQGITGVTIHTVLQKNLQVVRVTKV